MTHSATIRHEARPLPSSGFATRLLRRAAMNRLARLSDGEIEIDEGGRRVQFGRVTAACPLRATVTVHDPAFWSALALRGTLGAGESYMDGQWSCDDLTSLVRVLSRSRDVMMGLEAGLARLAAPLVRARHRLRRNSRSGSRRNVAEHYDLGNEFFSLLLDPTLAYSCAVFERDDATLEEAQIAKFDRVCRKLELRPGDRLLEIGTGWGGFAVHAASRYGVRVTTTTISREQHAVAARRIAEAGLSDRVTLLLDDYRDLHGRYDKLASIEMIEAVGHEYLEGFLRVCSERLEPDGCMLLQGIVIDDRHYEEAKRSVDFIQRYIFPGGALPSVSTLASGLARATDLAVHHLEELAPHYARTLRLWRERLWAHADRIRELGYPERFLRMFDFYLGYCEGGFAERSIGLVQMLLTKPRCRPRPLFATTD